jgi:hypothetical protein
VVPEEMVSRCDKTLKVEDLLNQPLHGNNITPAVNIHTNFKCLLKDAENNQATTLLLHINLNR